MTKVYVSSTVADLLDERKAVIEWLVAARHQPVESYGPASETVRESCLEDIDECDLFVLILGHRYGFQPEINNPENLSITHLEFRHAKDARIPCIALLRTSGPDYPEEASRVGVFQEEVRREVRAAEFSDMKGLLLSLSIGVQSEIDKRRHEGEIDDKLRIKDYMQRVQDAFVDSIKCGEQLTPEQANGRYVELLVQECNQKHQKSESQLSDAGQPSMAPLREFVQNGGKRVVVFGEGGMGKTTSVLKLATDAAVQALSDAKQPIPFYIKLNLFDSREHGIERLLTLFSNASHLKQNSIETLWRTGNRPCLFFMDGFNEVRQECQEACALALQEFMQPGSHSYVVTSRPSAQIEPLLAQIRGIVALEIVQLEDDQIEDFLVRHGAADLYEQIVSDLKGLVRNPFMLWALAQSCVGLPADELPRNRGQLYRNLIDCYIFSERERNKIPSPTEYNYQFVKQPILSRLGFEMKREGIMRRKEDLNLLKAMRDQLQEIRVQYDGLISLKPYELMPNPPVAKALLDEIVNNNVLRRIGNNLEFMHESVQDYFAAVHLESLGFEHNEVRECLRYNAWDEAVLILAGLMDDAGPLIEALAPLDPFLAVRCVKGTQRVSPTALKILQVQLNLRLSSRYKSEQQKAEQGLAVIDPPVKRKTEALLICEASARDTKSQEAERKRIMRELKTSIFQIPSPSPELVAEFKTRDVVDLVALLVDEHPFTSLGMAATEALRSLPLERIIPTLFQCLHQPESRDFVIWFMKRLPAEKILPHVLLLLDDIDPSVREAALDILDTLKDKAAVPHLIPLLQDASPRVRRRVIRALGALDAENAVPLLVPLLRDKEQIPPLPPSKTRVRSYRNCFNEMDEYIYGTEPRIAAARILGDIVTDQHIAFLSPLLSDDDPNIYNTAFEIFQSIRRRLNLPKDYPMPVEYH
jgi:ElaB/YqjD/DUF883 family membrane-anchored ribosome-binding protein